MPYEAQVIDAQPSRDVSAMSSSHWLPALDDGLLGLHEVQPLCESEALLAVNPTECW